MSNPTPAVDPTPPVGTVRRPNYPMRRRIAVFTVVAVVAVIGYPTVIAPLVGSFTGSLTDPKAQLIDTSKSSSDNGKSSKQQSKEAKKGKDAKKGSKAKKNGGDGQVKTERLSTTDRMVRTLLDQVVRTASFYTQSGQGLAGMPNNLAGVDLIDRSATSLTYEAVVNSSCGTVTVSVDAPPKYRDC